MIRDGFLDWAERRHGLPQKQYEEQNRGDGIACHSVVGNLPDHTIPGRFYDPDDAASVMFILYKDGHVTQMYPVTSSTWTSGSYAANVRYWAIEAEGGGAPNYGEKLTKEAEDSFIRIVTEWEEYTGRKAVPGVNLLQHKDLVRLYGGGATACASDRYSNAWERVASGERYGDMTPAEVEAIARRIFDEATPLYFLDLMKKYWTDVAEGDFSSAPDPAVVAGVFHALGLDAPGTFGDIPDHEHGGVKK